MTDVKTVEFEISKIQEDLFHILKMSQEMVIKEEGEPRPLLMLSKIPDQPTEDIQLETLVVDLAPWMGDDEMECFLELMRGVKFDTTGDDSIDDSILEAAKSIYEHPLGVQNAARIAKEVLCKTLGITPNRALSYAIKRIARETNALALAFTTDSYVRNFSDEEIEEVKAGKSLSEYDDVSEAVIYQLVTPTSTQVYQHIYTRTDEGLVFTDDEPTQIGSEGYDVTFESHLSNLIAARSDEDVN